MKKITIVTIASVLVSLPLFANAVGFSGPGAPAAAPDNVNNSKNYNRGHNKAPINFVATSSADVVNLTDGSYVQLKGNIVKQLDAKHYEFNDGTNSVTVKIDQRNWSGLTINPGDTIEIQGKVNKDWNSPVEVNTFNITKASVT